MPIMKRPLTALKAKTVAGFSAYTPMRTFQEQKWRARLQARTGCRHDASLPLRRDFD
jgi:hypothetical protein